MSTRQVGGLEVFSAFGPLTRLEEDLHAHIRVGICNSQGSFHSDERAIVRFMHQRGEKVEFAFQLM